MVPDGWRELSLDEIATYRRGSFPQPYGLPEWYDGDGAMPFVQVYDVAKNQRLKPTTKQQISTKAMPKSVFVPERSLLVTLQGSIGRVAITQYDAYVDRTLLIFTGFRTPTDLRFFSCKIEELFAEEKTKAPGGTIKTITKAVLSKFRIAIPPLPEQQKIAGILSTWDAAIEKTEALLATAKAQKRALMQSLLTGKRRFPEFEGQPWKEMRFENVFSRVRRKNTVANDNVLTISAQHGLVSQEKYFNKRVAAKDLSGYTLLHHGDFAYNKSYSRGYPLGAIKMLEVDEPGVVSSLYLCFALADESSNCREYFRHFFEAGRFNHEIYKFAQEGARNHGLLNVSSTDFFRAQINIPPLAEQQKIAVVLKDTEDQIAEHAQSVAKLRTEKKALMQQLLTGKRRVAV